MGTPDTESETGTDAGPETGTDAAPECVADTDCTTAAPCTVATCQDGVCVEGPAEDGTPCDDGDACTVDDHCAAGVCTGQSKACDDGVACTADSCDADTGQCLHDNVACACSPGTAATDCDDGNPCTADACVDGACSSTPTAEGQGCDDGDACTQGDTCQGGVCTGQAKACDDGLSCSVDVCDAGTGQCLHDTSACQCMTDADCDDGNPCTTETCAAAGACETADAPSSTSCDDGDACTVDDHCAAGVCQGVAKDCDDGIACTGDTCDAGSGQCQHDHAGCACAAGSAAADCDDGDPCTTDTCEATFTCAHQPVTGGDVACTDQDPCTEGDSCKAGVCGGVPKDCDDGLACSADSCDPTSGGCVHDMGACECTSDADCDDGEGCTMDICTSALTCVHTAGPDGAACGPEPVSGACLAGVCRGIVDFDLGVAFGCAVLATGQVRCWGKNDQGQLGTGDTTGVFGSPTDVTSAVALGSGDDGFAVKVATGWYHTCVIVKSGKVRCWGWGKSGRLGSGDEVDRTAGPSDPATTIDFGPQGPALEIAAGAAHTCVLLPQGKVACWDYAGTGKLGSGDCQAPRTGATTLVTARAPEGGPARRPGPANLRHPPRVP